MLKMIRPAARGVGEYGDMGDDGVPAGSGSFDTLRGWWKNDVGFNAGPLRSSAARRRGA